LGYWVITHIYPYTLLVFYTYLVTLFHQIYNLFSRVYYFSTWYQNIRNPNHLKIPFLSKTLATSLFKAPTTAASLFKAPNYAATSPSSPKQRRKTSRLQQLPQASSRLQTVPPPLHLLQNNAASLSKCSYACRNLPKVSTTCCNCFKTPHPLQTAPQPPKDEFFYFYSGLLDALQDSSSKI